jgi:NADP-dependent 3-hydroxy acid dehydrogenase YdfG
MVCAMRTPDNTGRVAVITGAASGIGEATARALAADGYDVALLARRAEHIQALADELGEPAIAVPADVTDREALVAASASSSSSRARSRPSNEILVRPSAQA